MPVSTQRGSCVIYVADSVHEFPPEVQDWLGRQESRALESQNVYDMLALLARGQHYAAIVVSIESVDWNELDFFEYATRLAGGTRIYVAGRPQQKAKIEAACKRGAEEFDARLLEEDLAPPTAGETAGDAEATLPGDEEGPEPAPPPPEPGPEPGALAPEPVPTPMPERLTPRPRRIFPETVDWASKLAGAPAGGRFSDLPEQPAGGEPSAGESVVSEEVTREREDPHTQSAESAKEEQSSPAVIPFPWAPSPDRPRRTPPSQATPEREEGTATRPGDVGRGPRPGLESGVRLTPEEIAALLSDPAKPDSSGRGSDT